MCYTVGHKKDEVSIRMAHRANRCGSIRTASYLGHRKYMTSISMIIVIVLYTFIQLKSSTTNAVTSLNPNSPRPHRIFSTYELLAQFKTGVQNG